LKLLQIIEMKVFGHLRSGNFLGLAGVFLCLLLLFQCGSKKSSTEAKSSVAEAQPAENRVVLQVKETAYSEDQFNKYVREEAGTEAKALEAPTLSRLFDEFIEQKLFLQAALDQKMTVSLDEKNQYLAKQAGESWPEEDQTALLQSDSGPLFDKMLVEKYVNEVAKDIKVDDDEIHRYYDLHKSEFFLPERVEVSQILLPTEAKAVEVWDKAKLASEEEFRAMATAESIGPEAQRGGEMGTYQKGQLPAEWEEPIFSLAEGQVTPVIESSYGFHVFRVDRKYEPEWIPLEKASTAIKLNLLDLKVKAGVYRRLKELEEELDWTAFFENLSFPYQRID
jgi:parvulin-like peptidyl-prolyl isomerase